MAKGVATVASKRSASRQHQRQQQRVSLMARWRGINRRKMASNNGVARKMRNETGMFGAARGASGSVIMACAQKMTSAAT